MHAPRLSGLVAAAFTPFRPDGSLDASGIDRQAERMIADGLAGVFVCGTTGEGPSLTTAERMTVADRWRRAAGSRLRVIVHVGHNCLEDCRALAAHAQRIGAAGIGCLAPSFFRPRTPGELADFCGRVAAAAPALPFYYYHLPSVTGVHLPVVDFLAAAAPRIPTLAGVKYTHEDLADFSACSRFEGGRFEMIFGRDEILLAALACGGSAAIGSTYNFMPGIFHEVLAAFRRGDLGAAQTAQARAADVVTVMNRHGGLPAGKAMMPLVGVDCGPVRPPLVDLDAGRRDALRRDLAALGFPDGIPTPSAS
jgi:N-acetylneuraminate lyase